MKTVKICGVPEHFNLPWHMCIENGEFEEVGIDLQWTDVPEGTGKMCQMLRENETDIAIILTEGIVKDIHDNQHSVIVQEYVKSPLMWGIHVDYNSPIKSVTDLDNKTAAISRYGSGSHLMGFVNAQNLGLDTKNLKFEIVNTIDGAVIALKEGKADYFLWEKFMTKPLVDNKTFRKIGECPTPWPCFVIAVSKKFLDENKNIAKQIVEIINTTTEEFKIIPSMDRMIAVRYNLELKDVQEWLSQTHWSQKNIDTKTIDNVIQTLYDLDLISKKTSADKILYNL
jgi:ABC-type nitrate/sulfonate/bicarbonate transport system substrate-binding protein